MRMILIGLLLLSKTFAAPKTDTKVKFQTTDNRVQIGSTFSPPVEYQGQYYFVATSGVLFESDPEFKKVTKLIEGKKQSMGALLLAEDKLWWGEGMHTDDKTLFHIYDLKTKKMIKELELPGHSERSPLILGDLLILPVGAAGIKAFNKKTFVEVWHTQIHNGKKLHVDSNLLPVSNLVCATSVYDYRGVICVEPDTGKVSVAVDLKKNPKSEIAEWKGNVVGFSTEADLVNAKFTVPADFYVVDVKNKKLLVNKELRGFNFFAPQITGDEAFVTLSTGDFLKVSLIDGKILYMGEFAEPFINNAFMMDGDFCGLGIMGKFLCFKQTKAGFGKSVDKRLMETPIGKVVLIGKKYLAPSRVGYFSLE